jgi:hypothetical protein
MRLLPGEYRRAALPGHPGGGSTECASRFGVTPRPIRRDPNRCHAD